MPEDLQAALEIPRGAGDAEIRKAQLKLARTHHPDKGGNPDQFKKIQKAQDVLSDAKLKDFQDQTGQVPGEQDNGPGPGFGQPMGPFNFNFDMNDLFGMFGGGGGPPGMRRGGGGGGGPRRHPGKPPAKHSQIPLTLHDQYQGRTLEVRLDRQRFCEGCKGEGSKSFTACAKCNGQGVVIQMVQMGPMVMKNIGPCTECMGAGRKAGPTCEDCKGAKFRKEEATIQLVIPVGAQPGMKATFHGLSSHQEDFEEAGDLIFEFQEAEEDTVWNREGTTLVTTVTVTLAQALCGTTITLGGHPGQPHGFCFELPAGTMNQEQIVLEGCGMPTLNKGDAKGIVRVTVNVLPTEKELELCRGGVLESVFEFVPTMPSVQPVWKVKGA